MLASLAMLFAATLQAQDLPDLSAWKTVLSLRPKAEVQKLVRGQGKDWAVHRIEDAKGKVNLDIYSVELAVLPLIDGKRCTKAELLTYVRLHLNEFVDPNITKFEPFNETQKKVWESEKPESAIILIDMKSFGINPDSGCVVCSRSTPNEWIFSTVRSGNALDAIIGKGACAHPVSGNRAFGIYDVDGKSVLYTVAADRPTRSIDDEMADSLVFPTQDKLWRGFQSRVAKFVNDNSGKASVKSIKATRFDWADIANSRYYDISDQPKWE